MAESYGITEENLATKNLLSGGHPVVLYPVILGSGAGELVSGQVLGRKTSDFKYYKFSAGASDGTETPRAVLARDTNASAADASTIAYVHGEFNQDKLDWNSATSEQIAEAKRKLGEFGIYVKKIG
jgi:hypothetical protein